MFFPACIFSTWMFIQSCGFLLVLTLSVQRGIGGGGGDGGLWGVQCLQHIPEPRAGLWLPEESGDWREDQQDQMAAPAERGTFPPLHQWWETSDTLSTKDDGSRPVCSWFCETSTLIMQDLVLISASAWLTFSSNPPKVGMYNFGIGIWSHTCGDIGCSNLPIVKNNWHNHNLCLVNLFECWSAHLD